MLGTLGMLAALCTLDMLGTLGGYAGYAGYAGYSGYAGRARPILFNRFLPIPILSDYLILSLADTDTDFQQ